MNGRFARWLVSALVLVVVAAAGWWGAQLTFATPADSDEPAATEVVAEVATVTVGRTLNFNATAHSPFRLAATNTLTGVVTDVGAPAVLDTGAQAYAVGDVPVRVVPGSKPFYRDLVEGMDGDDVRQLQEALTQLGYYRGSANGAFRPSTTRALKAWQKALGDETTGVVPLGHLVAVPSMPAAVRLGDEILVGATLSGGEPSVLVRSGDPAFTIKLNEDQAALVPVGARVVLTLDESTWDAVVAAVAPAGAGAVLLELTAPDGTLVCGVACASLPPQDEILLGAEVHVVPKTTGPGVPAAAVHTDAAGKTYVVMADGPRREVTVLATGDGLAVLDGVSAGELVVVIADERPDDTNAARRP